ncbi:uracil-DNA glycosylase [Mycoplasma sp. SG1]|uniref:uracil-DNA glycosylase n=1 Tax=Mycoplasma sp. SG1 TaxID=2810348 RepID=UPI00202502D7|nr:uracil-DNA glycosylase [Mycoplasma sp. SG1]URM52871.1 uracil-DNA glycosylase [Mycoplasma sp. SG1]
MEINDFQSFKENIDKSWIDIFNAEYQKKYFYSLLNFLEQEYKDKIIYPPKELIFHAFYESRLDNLKVIIIGQDPYHQPFQADGLAFSVSPATKITSSLRNIFKELNSDLGINNLNLSLSNWAKQGVLLLNTTLTVKEGEPLSHKNIGWNTFIINILNAIFQIKKEIILILWGKKAQKLILSLDFKNKPIILKAGHPSGLSAKYFLGCCHFSKVNQILIENNSEPINWKT